MNFLLKCVGLFCLILIQSCSDGSNPFITGTTGEIRIGSGVDSSFVEGVIETPSTSITEGSTVTVGVNIVDSNGALATSNGTVVFSSVCVGLSQASFGSLSVDLIAGSATTTYTHLNCPNTDTLTATATMEDGATLTANVALTITEVLRLGSGTGTGFQEGVITTASASVNTGGSVSISVNVVDSTNTLNTAVSTVNFSSTCSANSQARFTPAIVSSTGTATTTYFDEGCIGSDFITATLPNGAINLTATGNLAITPLRVGTGTGGGFTNAAITLGSASITEGSATTVSVNVVDSVGALITTPVTVNFSSTCSGANPATANFSNPTVVTSNGTASTNYQDAGCLAADTILATLDTVSSIDPVASTQLNIAPLRVGSGSAGTFVENEVVLGLASVSSGGSTSVSVNVVDAAGALITTPVTVSFNSNCVTQGFSSFDNTTASTINGSASVTYTAGANCSGIDAVRATINPFNNNLRTATANLTIAAPAPGSIQFTSTSQAIIALQGAGSSSGLPTTALITFTVLDSTGQPFANSNVTFSLNTTLGGVTFTPTTDTSDSNGLVQTTISSGNVSGSVRVTATVDATGLSTQSTAITISTGLPHQNSISLSASELNPAAWDHDNVQVTITALLADRFNNPIQDLTNISFTTELGSIESSCPTQAGACTVIWRSQSPRNISGLTQDGRTTILAHVVGEESFNDSNGDGVYSDTDVGFTDQPEAFVDWNENGVRDTGAATEPFKDFNVNGLYDGIDNLFNGFSCTHSTDCSTTQTTFVNDSIVLVMAEDNPSIVNIDINNVNECNSASDCTTANNYPGSQTLGTLTFDFTIVGLVNGQVLPVGTTIEFESDNGRIISGESHTIANVSQNASTTPAVATYSVTIGPESPTITSSNGNLTITVTTPGGLITQFPPIGLAD